MIGIRTSHILVVLVALAPFVCLADDLIYRYEGDVLPYDPSAGWIDGGCQYPCNESIENGHFVLRWPEAGNFTSYLFWITQPDEKPLPSLWVEWRFRSNYPIPQYSYTCDGALIVGYKQLNERVFMYGDAVVSNSADDFVWGLPNDEFRTYRFESPDGYNFWFSIDGYVFWQSIGASSDVPTYLLMSGSGGCLDDQIPDMMNEWDFVRFGTMESGEQIVSSDPPAGFVDARRAPQLDRYTITFDKPNYVYIDEVTVETTAGQAPIVTKTRRLEDGAPETVEVVLDRSIAFGATTRFTFNDGAVVNVVEYTYAPGDTDGDGDVDLADAAAFQRCFGKTGLSAPCPSLDANGDDTIDLDDYASWFDAATTAP